MRLIVKNNAFVAACWSAIERFSVVGIQFLVTLVLARILSPDDYGLIGMLAFFIAVPQTFIDSGFGHALVQKPKPTETDFNTIFLFNLFVSIVCYLVLFSTAPFIAIFFDEPRLTVLTRFISLGFVINAIGIIPRTRLTKNLDFKTQSKVGLISVLISGSLAIIAALNGCGVWTLVYQNLAQRLVMSSLLLRFTGWMPSLVFSLHSLKSLFSYGSKLLLSGLIWQFTENIYSIIVGKGYDVSILGYYSQAKRLQELPSKTLTSITQKVSFPLFSSIQKDKLQLVRVFHRVLLTTVYVTTPAMIMLIVIAKPIVLILLTDKWLPLVPFLQILAVGGVFYPLQVLNLSVIKSLGRSDLFLKLEILKSLILLFIILAVVRLDIYFLVASRVVFALIAWITDAYFNSKLVDFGVRRQFKAISGTIVCATIAAILSWLLGLLIPNIACRFAGQVLFYPIVYIFLSKVFGLRAYLLFMSQLRKIF
jgi:O-antigen/teichoic acid export membrane protein